MKYQSWFEDTLKSLFESYLAFVIGIVLIHFHIRSLPIGTEWFYIYKEV